ACPAGSSCALPHPEWKHSTTVHHTGRASGSNRRKAGSEYTFRGARASRSGRGACPRGEFDGGAARPPYLAAARREPGGGGGTAMRAETAAAGRQEVAGQWELTGNHYLALPCVHPGTGAIHRA